jgi:hypothetical protein
VRNLVCLSILIVLGSCASPQSSDTYAPKPAPEPSARTRPPRADLESDVFAVFSGTDASAMSALGQRLESERPSLPVGLLDRMLTFLHEHLTDDPGVRMLRPMLFRTVAVIIGTPARTSLQSCIASGGDADHLCEDTLREIDLQN